VERARSNGWHRQAYLDDRLLCEEDRPEAHLYSSVAAVEIDYVDDLAVAVAGGTTKIVCVIGDESAARSAELDLRTLLGDEARVVSSLRQFVEVTDVGATKSAGLRRVCTALGADIARAVAVGDAPNDADMLAAAGFGVAVAGGRVVTMDVARATCAGPAAGGVADVLVALGLARV
jgi:hydroxymethylpyrimidine pyrophosphatase-like HAD family hydrolase